MQNISLSLCNLLYRYADALDAGDFGQVEKLFSRARIKFSAMPPTDVGAASLVEHLRNHVRIFPDGTPRTRHIITNPIIEIDHIASIAKCVSSYTVLFQPPSQDIKIICSGRYNDEFSLFDDNWQFSFREYMTPILIGDMSGHMLGHVD